MAVLLLLGVLLLVMWLLVLVMVAAKGLLRAIARRLRRLVYHNDATSGVTTLVREAQV